MEAGTICLSKVIKAAVWEENPHLIDVPVPPQLKAEVAEHEELSEEAVQDILARIAYREQEIQDKIKDANIEAEIIRQGAQQEREQMLTDAFEIIEQRKAEGYDEGYAQGINEGRAAGEAKVREEMADAIRKANSKAEKTLRDARDARMDYLNMAEDDIVSIAMAAVERVLPQHFIDVPQMILPVVRDALTKVKDQKKVIVHVPPECYDFVLLGREELRSVLTAGDAQLEIKSDETLKAGDCLLETPSGGVDARLQIQLEALKQSVQAVMLKAERLMVRSD